MSVVGFDFGNSACKIAVARKRGIDVLQNEVGHRSTPSMVAFNGRQRFIGNEATAQYMSNGRNSVYQLKRLLGRKHDDPELSSDRKLLPFKIVQGERDMAFVEVVYEDSTQLFSAEQLTASLFIKLKTIAEAGLEGARVTDCVISVPASWCDAERRAVLDAAQIAGLNVLRLMNETTSVALQYGILRPLPKDQEAKVCFVDIGHSNTQVSVVGFSEGKLRVLSSAWDRNLGGRDFDEMLVTHFAKYIKDKYKLDPYTEPKAMMKLRKECERVKLMLTGNTKVPFNIEYLMNDRDVSGMIERSEFDSLVQQSLVPRMLACVKSALDRAGVTKDQINSVEVVGGSVRIPIVQKVLTDFFGKEVSKTCDGEESVARGCALMCAMISPSFKVKEFEVHDISPYPIEIAWGSVPSKGQDFVSDDSTPLFSTGNPIPSNKLISFNDRAEPFMLVARYSDLSLLAPQTNPIIGRFIVSGMPPRNADPNVKPDKIKVRVKLDIHGCLQVAGAQLLEELPEEPAATTTTTTTTAASTTTTSSTSTTTTTGSTTTSASPDDMDEDKEKASSSATSTTTTADKMETDKPADAAATGDAKVEPKKIKIRRVDLKIEPFLSAGLPSHVIQSFFEKEQVMIQTDRIIHETNAARNDLEAHILDMRNRLSEELSEYASEAEKQKINDALNAAEDWLYNDGSDAQKSEYKRKLEELKVHSAAAIGRHQESQGRGAAIVALQSTLANYAQWANNIKDEKYAHIDANERKQVLDEVGKVEGWLSTVIVDLNKLAKTENPKVTIAGFNAKKAEVEKFVSPIINRPKPQPPKPSPSPDQKANPDSAKPTTSTSAPTSSTTGADSKPADASSSSSSSDAKMETEKA